jgi:hypothetical protein
LKTKQDYVDHYVWIASISKAEAWRLCKEMAKLDERLADLPELVKSEILSKQCASDTKTPASLQKQKQ